MLCAANRDFSPAKSSGVYLDAAQEEMQTKSRDDGRMLGAQGTVCVEVQGALLMEEPGLHGLLRPWKVGTTTAVSLSNPMHSRALNVLNQGPVFP